jgi:protein-tyrosine kinase
MKSARKQTKLTRKLMSSSGEEFHQLHQSIIARTGSVGAHVLQFASPQLSEGVTTTVVAFGLFLSDLYGPDSVVLVEANFRNPTFGKLFGLPPERSLLKVLQREEDLEVSVAVIGDTNLSVIPAGRRSGTRDILSSEQFKVNLEGALTELKESYRFILVDSPEVIPYVDSCIVSRMVDGVIVVVEANRTRSEVADHAIEKLELAGANILGLILNKREYHIPEWIYRFI